jgi:hypothetical protein
MLQGYQCCGGIGACGPGYVCCNNDTQCCTTGSGEVVGAGDVPILPDDPNIAPSGFDLPSEPDDPEPDDSEPDDSGD